MNSNNVNLKEENIIDKNYFEKWKDQLTCTAICHELLNAPKMCKKCEVAFCGECISKWRLTSNVCPAGCTGTEIVDINVMTRRILNCLKMKCKYGCEVELLDYISHEDKCENNHKDDTNCWNCGNVSRPSEMKDKDESTLKQLKEYEDFLVKSHNLAEENETGQKEIDNFSELLKLKGEKSAVDQKYYDVEQTLAEKQNLKTMIESLQKELNEGRDIATLQYDLSKFDKERKDLDVKIDKVSKSIKEIDEEKKLMKEDDELKSKIDNLRRQYSINNEFNNIKLAIFTRINHNYVATSGNDFSINVFHLDDQSLYHTFKGHTSQINCIKSAVLENNQTILVSCSQNIIRVFNVDTKNLLYTLNGHEDTINALSIIKGKDNQTILISAGIDSKIRIWNLNTGKILKTLEESRHESGINCLYSFKHNDIIMLASAGIDNKIKIWNLERYTLEKTIEAHTKRILSLEKSIYKNTPVLISANEDKTIKLWNINNWSLVATLNGGDGIITSLNSFNFNNQNMLLSSGDEKMIRVWSMKNGKLIKIICGLDTKVNSLDCISNLNNQLTIIAGGDDGVIRTWAI